jgi:hypothetical protein
MSDCYDEEDSAINELMEYAHTGPDNPDQEEANFYFALHEFKSIVEKYGVENVLAEMDTTIEDKLYDWYNRGIYEADEDAECGTFEVDIPKVGAGNLQGDGADSKTGAEYKNGISHIAPWLNEEPPF